MRYLQNDKLRELGINAQFESVVNRSLYEQVMVPNYEPMEMLPEKAAGSKLWDSDGNCYLDFAGGIAVSALGHCHPALIEVLTHQANQFWHVSNVLTNKPAIHLAKLLCESTFAERVFFASSGSEANEAALKMARRYAVDHYFKEKYEILAFDSAFHGRTFFTVSTGGQAKYSSGFGPKPAGISHVPFNDCVAVEKYFQNMGDRVCAVILEPCQGEGGVVPATQAFIATIQNACRAHNALMIFDEIQTGVGRTGTLYAYQQYDAEPDILTTAKALGCGVPISAMLTKENIANSLVVGTHGSTFGGNPMACAVASKALQLINTPELLQGVTTKSQKMKSALVKMGEKYGVFKEVRGMGLLLGCQLADDFKNRARDVLMQCNKEGLLVLVAGSNVVRLAPALNIADEEIEQGLQIMEKVIANL